MRDKDYIFLVENCNDLTGIVYGAFTDENKAWAAIDALPDKTGYFIEAILPNCLYTAE